jgi:zinc protease
MKSAKSDVTRTVFENGLTLLTLEKHNVPIVTSSIWYNVGSANEANGHTGISHFLEHLMFKGTQTYAKGEIDFLTSTYGGNNNAGTIYDYTMYYFNFSSDRWEIALTIEADRMCNCLFDLNEFESERKVVLEELKQQQDSPWGKLGIQLEATMFRAHPYHHTPIGLQEDIEQISRDTIIEYYKAYYIPNNATIIIIGDIQTQAVIQNVEQIFAHILRGEDIPELRVRESGQQEEQRFEILQDTSLKRVQIGYHAATLSDKNNYTLDVLDNILSHGKTARLYQRLVEQEQLVTFVNTYNHPRRLPGAFYLFAELRPEVSPEKIEQVLNEEICRLQNEPITLEELQKIKNIISADFMFEKETTMGLTHALGEYESLHTYEYMDTYLECIAQITPEEVMQVAKTYLTENNRTIGWSLPKNPDRERHVCLVPDSLSTPSSPDMVFHKPFGQNFRSHRWILDNGLTVLFLENHFLPTVSLEAFVDTGQKYVPDEKAGMAFLTGRLLEEGTTNRTAFDIAQTIESVGGNLHTRSRGISTQVLSKDFTLVLDIVSDILIRSVFAQKNLEKERRQILSLLDSDEDNLPLIAFNLFHEMVYGSHPYHRPQKGYKDAVQMLTQSDILEYYNIYFVPNNSILAIVGDVAPAEVIQQVQRYFGEWKQRELLPGLTYDIPTPAGCVTKHIQREREQNHIYLGHPGITRTDPDYYTLLTMDHILGTGSGFTDRISRRLRDEQGLAYTVYANIAFSAEADPGTFMAYIGTSPTNTNRAIEEFLEEIKKIRAEHVAQEELKLAQNYLTGSYVFHFETSTQLARYLVHTERFELGDDFLWKYPQLINRVTIDDIQRVAQQHLDPENYYVAIVGTIPE